MIMGVRPISPSPEGVDKYIRLIYQSNGQKTNPILGGIVNKEDGQLLTSQHRNNT